MSTHPQATQGQNLKSVSHRCHPILVAFVRELTRETIDLPLGCLLGGVSASDREITTGVARLSDVM